ncbi:MAG: tetratricopeptide repeat protein [Pirellulales bacterium]
MFFISGATGLAYQVVWFKRFSHVWGSSSLAFAAVAGSFLFGLGLGAYLFGRSADRAAIPLRWYGVCELLIGAMALVIPFEIAALVDASVGLYARIPEQPLLRYLVQFCITLLVVGPPCVLMGGTLPLLIRQLTARDGSLDQATGWLYAINTFGAAAGCYLTGFHLLPSLGLLWTNNFAAAVNLAIGLVALAAGNAAERLSVGRSAPGRGGAVQAPLAAWSPQLAGLYAATALAGCAALVLEMTWTRQLSLVLGGSTYALSATLFVVLLGIALGSLTFHGFLRGVASSPMLPPAVIAMVVLGTLAGIWMLPALSISVWPQSVRELRSGQMGNGAICVAVSAAVELLPAVGMGILFPLFVHLTRASAAKVGSAVGNIYAWNTFGSIAGASLTAVLLFPRIGTSGASALAAAMYVVSLLGIMPWRGTVNLAKVGAAAAAGAAAVVLVARPIDPRLTNMGLYLYGQDVYGDDLGEWNATLKPLYFREGASSNVFVARKIPNSVSLRVNGKVDASNGVDMATQTGVAYFPRMFKPDAKEVLVIGFGSGCTSGRSLLFPNTHVTCCELEPAVYAAAEHFGQFNSRPHEKTRAALLAKNAKLPPQQRLTSEQIDDMAQFSIIFGDGRTALQGSGKKYDIVISEPSNPWIAGISNLFTREFFRAAREHLTDGGVLAQWIQAYNFTLDDYLMIVRTMRSEFPYCGLVELSGGVDTLLLASTRPLAPDPKRLAALEEIIEATPTMKADFEAWFGGTDLRWVLLSNYVLGSEPLDRLVGSSRSRALNTDLHLRLEFDAPLQLFRQLPPKETVTYALAVASDDRWKSQLAGSLGLRAQTPEFYVTLGDFFCKQATTFTLVQPKLNSYYWERAAHSYQNALNLEPDHALAKRSLARTRLWLDTKSDPEITLRKLVELEPGDAVAHAQLASLLLGKKNRPEAAKHYREALRLQPELSFETRTYTWANNLAWLLATSPESELRDGPEAVRLAKLACQIAQDNDPGALDTLAAALAEVGRFQEAIEACKRAIELAPEQAKLVKSVKDRLKLYEASQPYHEG